VSISLLKSAYHNRRCLSYVEDFKYSKSGGRKGVHQRHSSTPTPRVLINLLEVILGILT